MNKELKKNVKELKKALNIVGKHGRLQVYAGYNGWTDKTIEDNLWLDSTREYRMHPDDEKKKKLKVGQTVWHPIHGKGDINCLYRQDTDYYQKKVNVFFKGIGIKLVNIPNLYPYPIKVVKC